MYVEIRGQFEESGSLLPPCGAQVLNSARQFGPKVPSPSEMLLDECTVRQDCVFPEQWREDRNQFISNWLTK